MGRMALPKNDCILVGRWILHLLSIHAQSISMERKCGRQRELAHRVKGAGEGVLGEGLETWEWLPSLGWMTPNLWSMSPCTQRHWLPLVAAWNIAFGPLLAWS